MRNMNDILEGTETEETAEVAEQETEAEEEANADTETEAESEPEKGESEEKGEKEESESTPDTDVSDEVRGLLAATKAEREKRQKAESELERLRKEAEEKAETPSVFEDEEGFVTSLRKETDQRILNERLNISEAYARDKFGSEAVDEKMEVFKKMAEESPEVAQRVLKSPLPWVEMVQVVDKHQELEAMKDVDSYKAKLRAEVEQELRKEYENKLKEKEKLRGSVQTSLVDAPSKGSLKGSDWEGPTPLKKLIG